MGENCYEINPSSPIVDNSIADSSNKVSCKIRTLINAKLICENKGGWEQNLVSKKPIRTSLDQWVVFIYSAL